MWKWDQGRLHYFQYDALRAVAAFVVKHDMKNSERSFIREQTGLDFLAPATHSPWRNYSRIYKLCMLVTEIDKKIVPTSVARILSQDGAITCDEYIHFLVEATTDPSPVLTDWSKVDVTRTIRSPLCFSLKYILAKAAGISEFITPINEIIGAYIYSNFTGDESDEEFLYLLQKRSLFEGIATEIDTRPARESIKFISQISYLHNAGKNIVASIARDNALDIFNDIHPIAGKREADGNREILRISELFKDGSTHDFFDYKATVMSDVVESGFREGNKVKKTHIVIERNTKLRELFFKNYPSAICDSCHMDTSAKYPWLERVLDVHHVLPLSSGTRVDSQKGTMLEDLAPICPTCHRAIHRYYDNYLSREGKKDFKCKEEAQTIYQQSKASIVKGDNYV